MSAIQPAIRSALQPAIRSAILSYGAVAWSPLTLFAASDVGVWYDPSDFSTMYQDSAGTTPVTAVGDPVGKILDKSGNGKHATQATAASRPILRNDGTNYYLEFDGVDDSLATAAIDFSATSKIEAFTGLYKGSSAARGLLFEMNTSGGVNSFSSECPQGAAAETIMFSTRGTASSTTMIPSFVAGSKKIFSWQTDTAVLNTSLRMNGVLSGPFALNTPAVVLGNYPLYFGRRNGADLPLNARVYSLIIRGALSDAAQIAAAEAYVAGKSGVTL